MVLIFSQNFEYSTDMVILELIALGQTVIRINGDDDIYKFDSITDEGIFFCNTLTNEIINLEKADACWWRRSGLTRRQFTAKEIPDLTIDKINLTELLNGKKNILDDEIRAIIEYINTRLLDIVPIKLGKPKYNLNRLITAGIAKKFGFKIPEHNIITRGNQLTTYRTSKTKYVTKAISNGIYELVGNHRFYTYTEILENDCCDMSENIKFFPSLISSLIEKAIEIRTFFLAGRFYSMAIFSQSNEKTSIDYRKYANNRQEPYLIPEKESVKLKNVFDALDLNTGSADLIIDRNNEFIFLEINPVGQFDMTSKPCNYHLHKKVAEFLIYGN
ncbi:MAG: grasp-with-spasm system ATP-grasp peptide maturase [Bacteroidetes bacterium]|nr:grasp-with-spasm system ATP-grasp peptide maturase [Bacteroidota bacterium]